MYGLLSQSCFRFIDPEKVLSLWFIHCGSFRCGWRICALYLFCDVHLKAHFIWKRQNNDSFAILFAIRAMFHVPKSIDSLPQRKCKAISLFIKSAENNHVWSFHFSFKHNVKRDLFALYFVGTALLWFLKNEASAKANNNNGIETMRPNSRKKKEATNLFRMGNCVTVKAVFFSFTAAQLLSNDQTESANGKRHEQVCIRCFFFSSFSNVSLCSWGMLLFCHTFHTFDLAGTYSINENDCARGYVNKALNALFSPKFQRDFLCLLSPHLIRWFYCAPFKSFSLSF